MKEFVGTVILGSAPVWVFVIANLFPLHFVDWGDIFVSLSICIILSSIVVFVLLSGEYKRVWQVSSVCIMLETIGLTVYGIETAPAWVSGIVGLLAILYGGAFLFFQTLTLRVLYFLKNRQKYGYDMTRIIKTGLVVMALFLVVFIVVLIVM